MRYGLALKEKYGIDGLNKEDINFLYSLVTDPDANGSQEVFPIELEARAHESSAMGFITPKAAELIDYDYEGSGLHDYLASIMDDIENESPDNQYTFKGIDIYFSR